MNEFSGGNGNLPLQGLAFWGNIDTYTRTSANVGRWNSLGGSSIFFEQIKTSTAVPTVATTLRNGISGLAFPGRLVAPNSTAAFNGLHQGDGTAYLVNRNNGATYAYHLGSGGNPGFFVQSFDGLTISFAFWADNSSAERRLDVSHANTETKLHCTVYGNSKIENWQGRSNDSTSTTVTFTTGDSSANMRIGTSAIVDTAIGSGNVIYELALFNVAHTAAERYQWQNYLAQKYAFS
jgi:hypothetical protein